MKKFLVSAFVLVTFILYSFNQKFIGSGNLPVTPVTLNNENDSTSTSTSSTVSTQASNSNPTTTTTQVTTPIPSAGFKDGQFTGDVVDAYYGNVQVKATISGGKITDVQFLDYPHDRQQSNYINSQATSMLRTEAIQAQSANVDIISGATATSQAFIQSLGSALAKAK